MELSTFAYTIGVIELLFALPLLFYSKQTAKWMDKFMKDDVQMRVIGAFMTILGALVILDSPTVSLTAEGLVRLLAWACFVKGIMYCWWPKVAANMKKKWLKEDTMLTVGGVLACAVGILLLYAGSIV